MKLFIICLLLFSVVNAAAQIVSDCTAPTALKNAYSNDIKDLALYRLYQTKSPDTALIEIPQAPQDTILAALAAVFNLGRQWEADSVFLNYCVHQWPWHPLTPATISVKVNPDSGWTKEWAKRNIITGYAALDRFISLHHITNVSYQYDSRYPDVLNNIATLSVSSPINMYAFWDSLRRFPGVLYVTRSGFGVGDGDHIFYAKDSNAHLSFWAGWGDCPSGCTSGKNWKYTVSLSDCRVWKDTILLDDYDNYEERYLLNCNLAPLAALQPPIVEAAMPGLLPNPAADALYIRTRHATGCRYQISDMMGRILAIGNYSGRPIDLHALLPGLYTCIIQEGSRKPEAIKFMKL